MVYHEKDKHYFNIRNALVYNWRRSRYLNEAAGSGQGGLAPDIFANFQ
jgi:hypothetical protein